MGIGQRIKDVRTKKKISVKVIADAAGVSRQAVYAWESGNSSELRGSNLVAVARVLDVSVEWLDKGKGAQGSFREHQQNLPAVLSADEALAALAPEAAQVAHVWSQLSPGRRAKFLEEMSWARFFESKFPPYRLGIANASSYEKFERNVEASWDKMMRQGKLALE